MNIHKKLYELPDKVDLPPGYSIRPTYKKDAKCIRNLINNYLSKFKVKTQYSTKDVEHWFTRKESKSK